jgi:hypothetical protein
MQSGLPISRANIPKIVKPVRKSVKRYSLYPKKEYASPNPTRTIQKMMETGSKCGPSLTMGESSFFASDWAWRRGRRSSKKRNWKGFISVSATGCVVRQLLTRSDKRKSWKRAVYTVV